MSVDNYKYEVATQTHYICVSSYNSECGVDIYDMKTRGSWSGEIIDEIEQKVGSIKDHIQNNNYTYKVSYQKSMGKFIIGSEDEPLCEIELELGCGDNHQISYDYIKLLTESISADARITKYNANWNSSCDLREDLLAMQQAYRDENDLGDRDDEE
jgi:hypothetical protein